MPTYEYKCDACGETFERFQPITAPPVRVCPNCHKSRVRRLIGAGAGIIFKGSGFYVTDYRSDSYRNAARSESGNGSSTSSTSSSASSGGNGASTPKPASKTVARKK